MTGADVVIVVLSWNRAQETMACIESLRAADLGGARILVVDNGSRDGSVTSVRAAFPDIEVIALPENRGYAGGNNVGIRAALEAGARAVLLLNNDTRVAPDFLPPLLSALESSPDCGAVSSAILRMDRPDMHDLAYAEVRFRDRWVVQLRGVRAPVLDVEGSLSRRLDVPVVAGCCVLLSAEALRRVGLFDEAYFAYHEDVDWCLRAKQAGYRFFYEPYSRVYHRGSATTGGFEAGADARGGALPAADPRRWNPVRAYLGARNTIRLLNRHATPEDLREHLRLVKRSLPREFGAIVCGREGWVTLGRWSLREMAAYYFMDRHGIPRTPPARRLARLARRLRLAAWLPVDLLLAFPLDVWRAWRSRRLDEIIATVRGIVDGLRDRPLPLRRLGLR